MRGCDVTIGSRPGCVVVASMKASWVGCPEWPQDGALKRCLRIYRTGLEGLAGMLLIGCFFKLN